MTDWFDEIEQRPDRKAAPLIDINDFDAIRIGLVLPQADPGVVVR